LAIETSCDETAVAVMRGGEVLAAEVASQIEVHRRYGGVVPEVASRNHIACLPGLLEEAEARSGIGLGEIDVFAATSGPGLAIALLVGVAAAKGLAVGYGRPFVAVNHLEGHLLSPFFGGTIEPSVGLIVSGGHTLLVDVAGVGAYRVLGRTRDDAAGEAFDKVAKLLGLPYPGGPEIDARAASGDAGRFALPRALMGAGDLDFSFSGLKTAVRYLLPGLRRGDLADVCASFREAVVEVLVEKAVRAARAAGRRVVGVSGGVSRNIRLRERLAAACAEAGLELRLAPEWLCTDNAAMIARVAALRAAAGCWSAVDADIDPAAGIG
jgi:N6-L-threonylcarbamoyladenine synthase